MSAPIWNIDDIVYLVESAKVGAIESYQVAQLRQDATGVWYYTIAVPLRPPNSNMTYGDRIGLRQNLDFELAESELCTYCEAVDLALASARANLARLEQLKSIHCTDEVTGGTGGRA